MVLLMKQMMIPQMTTINYTSFVIFIQITKNNKNI